MEKKANKCELSYIDFLDSELVSLQAGHAGRLFKIHRKLLGLKCEPVIAALDGSFDEGRQGIYRFDETTEGTVARFIEWAYRGDYPTVISEIEPVQKSLPHGIEANVEGKPIIAPPAADFTSENHPLLVHIRLYIFSGTYLIPELQHLAFEKVTACFMDLEKPNSLDTQLAVIDAVRLSFLRLHEHDTLLNWLSQYSAYCIDKLRLQSSFHDLLRDFPILSSRMMLSLNPASSPPWKITQPKYPFTHYSPSRSAETKYDY
ncbi:hypothetical protein ASPBRDRAFT_139494 [Aspergillus brasiliensis CBS 101740]|uniref:BTB domain-containing protein n=1 Tax=Aspergillus brasiliensis (strain CBS 101740 / IMI 381727 / IBT 21946) TaxID=767769 RepID=A0A1L9U223_ASPBC|nr:hypothetical protein ASPBRDRAFT_139494 [Aspergillus brasiliensis CBS 101740]